MTGQWFSPGPPVSSTNKIDHHDITEILLKVALNTIKQTNKPKIKHPFLPYHRLINGIYVHVLKLAISVNSFSNWVVEKGRA